MTVPVSENEIKLWEADQRYCDIADDVLKVLAEKGLSAKETRYVLDKAQKAVDASVDAVRWGAPFTVMPASNTSFVHDKVAAEINRRNKCVEVCQFIQAEYDALSEVEKNNGTRYLVQ